MLKKKEIKKIPLIPGPDVPINPLPGPNPKPDTSKEQRRKLKEELLVLLFEEKAVAMKAFSELGAGRTIALDHFDKYKTILGKVQKTSIKYEKLRTKSSQEKKAKGKYTLIAMEAIKRLNNEIKSIDQDKLQKINMGIRILNGETLVILQCYCCGKEKESIKKIECGHAFCDACFSSQVEADQKKAGTNVRAVKCLFPTCNYLLSEKELISLSKGAFDLYCKFNKEENEEEEIKFTDKDKLVEAMCIVCFAKLVEEGNADEKEKWKYKNGFNYPICGHGICFKCFMAHAEETTKGEILLLTNYNDEAYQPTACPMRDCKSTVETLKCVERACQTWAEKERIYDFEALKMNALYKFKEGFTINPAEEENKQKLKCYKCEASTGLRSQFRNCGKTCSFRVCLNHRRDAYEDIKANDSLCLECKNAVGIELENLNKTPKT